MSGVWNHCFEERHNWLRDDIWCTRVVCRNRAEKKPEEPDYRHVSPEQLSIVTYLVNAGADLEKAGGGATKCTFGHGGLAWDTGVVFAD